jgi:hypothetical protein
MPAILCELYTISIMESKTVVKITQHVGNFCEQ